MFAPSRPYRYPELADLTGKILACIWGAFYSFILLGTSATLNADPSQAPALVWLCLGPLGTLGGVAVILLIRRRPDIGALAVVSGFVLWLVVEKYRPDTWYMVPALLCPGLVAIAVLLNIWARKPPPDVIRVDRPEFAYKTHDDEYHEHTR